MKTSLKPWFVVVIVLTLAQFACNSGAGTPSVNLQDTSAPQQPSAVSPASTEDAAPNLPPADAPVLSGAPADILAQALRVLPTVSYRKKEWFMDSQGAPIDLNQPPQLVAEFTPPNNSHVISTRLGLEQITLNGNFYQRPLDGEWQLTLPDASGQDAQARAVEAFMQVLQNGGVAVQAAGSGSLNGIPAQVFSFTGQADVFPVIGKAWIGNDGRLIKMELAQPDSNQIFDVSLYEYDPGIVIQAPM